jgi:heme-degrading monooxygenase HmoA
MKFREMDRRVTYAEQLGGDEEPVELINVFVMDTEDVEVFLQVWAGDAAHMKRQPGFIRTQLHRGIGGSATFVNIATWESPAALRAAFTAPEFQAAVRRYPQSVEAFPHLCATVAVSGVCTA